MHKKSQKHLLNKENYENTIKNIELSEKENVLKQKEEELESLKKKYYKLKKKNKTIEQEKDDLETEKEIIEKEKQEIEKQKQELEKEQIKLKSQVNIYKEYADRPKTVNNNTMTNNLSYVNNNYPDAPALTTLNNFILNGIDMDDNEQIRPLVDLITNSYNNKSLHKCIGDHVIKHYKKEDKSQQSFHTTDVSRKKFLVKLDKSNKHLYNNYDIDELNDNINSKWITDNDGVKISHLLYEPMIDKILKKLKNFCKKLSKRNVEDLVPDDVDKLTTLVKLFDDIDTDKLKNDINKYTAPHFELNK
jgi:hypothetical protein